MYLGVSNALECVQFIGEYLQCSGGYHKCVGGCHDLSGEISSMRWGCSATVIPPPIQ